MQYLYPWPGLLTLAWLDDERFMFGHIMGIIFMVLGISSIVYHHRRRGWATRRMALALTVYLARLVMKVMAILFLELKLEISPMTIWSCFVTSSPHSSGRWAFVAQYMLRIMVDGRVVSPWTLAIFRLCGVMQWSVLVLFCSII